MMKKNFLLFVCVILLSSCHQTKPGMVKDFIDTSNDYDKEEMGNLLADNFTYYGKDTLGKSDYLAMMDSLKVVEYNSTILKIQDLDSIVKTEEQESSIIDSLLEVTPVLIQHKTYRFSNNKLESITVDSVLNYDEYTETLHEKMIPFTFYVYDQHDIQNEKEFMRNIKKYLAEYVNLPVSDKREYRTYAHLQGTYVSRDCAFYRKLIFRGKKTVTIVDAIFGFSFASGYEVDENLIRIRTDKSDLLFEVKDSKTLVGEGFAKGTFRKTN